MFASRQLAFDQRTILPPLSSIIPAAAGCIMLYASVLPWLSDPLGKVYSAWQLPIDIGWQFHIAPFSYGLLCLCCAVYAFLVAYANWKPFRGVGAQFIAPYFVQRHVTAGILCIIPVALFLLQYLCVDMAGAFQLAQHKTQALLIQQHLNYKLPKERISLSPFLIDSSTIWGRLVMLVDQVSIGPLLPCLSGWMLLESRRFSPPRPGLTTSVRRHKRTWLIGVGLLILVVILGRAPAAMACEYQARASLLAGDYRSAVNWLNRAVALNAALDQMSYYHEERGQALYFLHPDQQSDESRVYLASAYRQQGDYLGAYQQLLAVEQSHHAPSWVVDEMSMTLERLAELTQPLKGPPTTRPDNDVTALPWLRLLTQADPSNVYGQYVLGRIQYDIHDYTACVTQMGTVLELNPNADIQSSAYTYIALSDAGQGDYLDARKLLFKAVELDPNYWNNTARQELSGLR